MSYKNNRAELIENMIAEYGFLFCEHCKKSNSFKFHTHHIIFRSEKPKHVNLHCKINLIIVCNNCHDLFHENKTKRNYLIDSRKLNELFNDEYLKK